MNRQEPNHKGDYAGQIYQQNPRNDDSMLVLWQWNGHQWERNVDWRMPVGSELARQMGIDKIRNEQ